MTSELLNQINLKNDMYVEWNSQSTSIDIYNSIIKHLKKFKQKYRHCPKNYTTTHLIVTK